jgi:hypothetical protein
VTLSSRASVHDNQGLAITQVRRRVEDESIPSAQAGQDFDSFIIFSTGSNQSHSCNALIGNKNLLHLPFVPESRQRYQQSRRLTTNQANAGKLATA